MDTLTYQPQPQDQLPSGIFKTPLTGLYFIPYKKHEDQRGFYAELTRLPEINSQVERPFIPQQVNLSHSKQNVIRGFHAENWRKLLTITQGQAFCAFADFRADSPTFGNVITATIGEDALAGSFFLPWGIGNSFLVTKGPLDYLYAVDELYANRDTSGDVAISLFDPDLDVKWPLEKSAMIISERDNNAISLRDKFPDNFKE